MFGLVVLWHINPCGLFNAKSFFIYKSVCVICRQIVCRFVCIQSNECLHTAGFKEMALNNPLGLICHKTIKPKIDIATKYEVFNCLK